MASGSIAQRLAGIPIVRNNAERDAIFPSPDLRQRVDNLFTGSIQRWNGTAWIDVYFAGALSTGTPSTLVNDALILAQPQANNFLGRVEGVADGTEAQVTIPDLPIWNDADAVILASPRALRFRGTGVTPSADGTTADILITAGGGAAIGVNGETPIGPFDTIEVDAPGATIVDEGGGVGTLTVPGPTRSIVELVTGTLATDEVGTGTVAVGALAELLRVASTSTSWLRLYATAADRTADAGRLITVDPDPDTAILFDAIFDGTTAFDCYPSTVLRNLDVPATDVVYYSVTQLDPAATPVSLLAEDIPAATGSIIDTNLIDHVPTNPLASGWTEWESTETNRLLVWGLYGGILVNHASGSTVTLGRSNVDFDHANLTIASNIYRLSVADAGEISLCLHVPDTAIGSFDNTGYVRARIYSDDATNAFVALEHVAAGTGTVTQLDTAVEIPWALSSSKEVKLQVVAGTLDVIVAGTGLLTAAVPGAVSANARIGIQGNRFTSSSGYYWPNIALSGDASGGAAPVVYQLTRTLIERA